MILNFNNITDEQKAMYAKANGFYKRTTIEGQSHVNTLAHHQNIIDPKFIKDLYNNYEINLRVIMEFFGCGYINVTTPIKDKNNGISFEKFSFTKESMMDDIRINGMYQPILVSTAMNENVLTIIGGRHRIICIRELNKQGYLLDTHHLYIDIDSYSETVKCNFIIPNVIIEKVFLNYFTIIHSTPIFSTIEITSIVDLWFMFKLQERELDLILEKHMDLIIQLNMQPISYLTKEVNYEKTIMDQGPKRLS